MITKVSVYSEEFRQPITKILGQGNKVVIWHQIPWSGGMQEWFLIDSISTLDKILDRGHVASAFTAYEWTEISTSQAVNQAWLEQISSALQKETHNLMILVKPVTHNTKNDEPVPLTWLGEQDDVQEYLKKHSDSKATVGRISSFVTGEIIRGYYPDDKGTPNSGAY